MAVENVSRKCAESGATIHAVGAARSCQPHRLAAAQGNAVQMPLERAFFRGSEIDLRGVFVHRFDAVHLPVAARDLRELLAGKIVQIQMAESRALARPQKSLAVSDKSQIVGDVDPALVDFAENGLRPAVAASAKSRSSLFCVRVSRWMATRRESGSQSTRARSTDLSAPVSIQRTAPPDTGTTPTRATGLGEPAIG